MPLLKTDTSKKEGHRVDSHGHTPLLISEETAKVANRFLIIANKHTQMQSLLEDFEKEIKSLVRCEAIGIRILDEEGNIPYQAYAGFSQKFYESENLLSITRDQCMCINVINGAIDAALPFYTRGGSFYMNGTTRFLSTISEEEKGSTRNTCNKYGYESVALIPIRIEERILGLIHIADQRTDTVPLQTVEVLEGIAMQLGGALERVRAGEKLYQANQRLKELDRLKSMFIASMSHELRTPLNSIIGFTGIMLQGMAGSITEEQGKQLGLVKNSAKHLLDLINDIIDVSKIEAEKIELFIEEINLSDIINETGETFKVLTANKGLKLSVETPAGLMIKSDERRVKQIIMNLMSNAIKFTNRGGIALNAVRKKEGAEVLVRDSGVGMREEHLQKLFKAFNRPHD